MALNAAAIVLEIQSVQAAMKLSAANMILYCQLKKAEAAINGGIASYSINGRSVAKDLAFWDACIASYRVDQAAEDPDLGGGVAMQEIRFR